MQKLKEYQKLDMEKRRIEQEVLDSADRKNAKEMQSKLKEYQSGIFDLERKAETATRRYEELVKALEKCSKDIQSENAKVAKVNESDIEAQMQSIKKLKDSLLKIEKEIASLQKIASQITNDNAFIMKNAVIANKNLAVYKERYNATKQSREPEIRDIETKMAKLEGGIDKALFVKYKTIRETKPLPVFVPLKDNRCSGCRMEMPIVSINNLKQKGYIECENCGRIIYFEEK